MKKISILAVIGGAMLLGSCGGAKQIANGAYYNNPQPQVTPVIQKQEELKTLEVDKLVAEETDRLRAVGVATDDDENEARKEALQNGQQEIASLLETSVVALTQVYNQKTKVNKKKTTEQQRKEFVEFTVSQKISTRAVGTPNRFLNADGSFQIYRCVELKMPTAELLGEIHDELTREEVIGVDYDKQKFIKDNLEKIQELRENVK
jgi:G:T/U-mismatch repair DNA glycosylase